MLTQSLKVMYTLGLLFCSMSLMAGDANKAFDKLDVNGDGYISKSEATQRADLRQQWTTVDANRDDKLTEAEFSAFETIPRDQPFSGE